MTVADGDVIHATSDGVLPFCTGARICAGDPLRVILSVPDYIAHRPDRMGYFLTRIRCGGFITYGVTTQNGYLTLHVKVFMNPW